MLDETGIVATRGVVSTDIERSHRHQIQTCAEVSDMTGVAICASSDKSAHSGSCEYHTLTAVLVSGLTFAPAAVGKSGKVMVAGEEDEKNTDAVAFKRLMAKVRGLLSSRRDVLPLPCHVLWPPLTCFHSLLCKIHGLQ